MVHSSDVLVVIDADAYYLFKDLCELPGINKYVISSPSNKVFSIAYKLHTNKQIGKHVWLPWRDVWFSYREIERLLPEHGYLLVNSMALSMPTLSFWKKLKCDHPTVRFVLLLVDSMHGKSKHIDEVRYAILNFSWDIVLSYDQNDCLEYGFRYIGFSYYSNYTDIIPSNTTSDLYYIATLKGRENLLREIDKACKENGVDNLFKIHTIWRDVDYGEKIRKFLPYTSLLSDVMSTNCILEVVSDGQCTQSLRYLEALCYNKKLLSNNPCLKTLPYYDERYMRYFARVEDVDWSWVKKKELVVYEEKPDISSAALLKYLF